MDLYVDPAATTSRAVLAFCEAEGVEVNVKTVCLMRGEHHAPPLAELNPNRLVPVLVDDGFILTESSAILRYLARRFASPLYPAQHRQQARVDELIAWFEANFYRDFGFQFVYPQLMPHHRRATEEATRLTIEWGREHSNRWLKVLNGHFLAHGKQYLLGETLTIADFFGASILSLGELVQCRFEGYPNVRRWHQAMNGLESWRKVNSAFHGFVASLGSQRFVDLQADPHAAAA